MTKNAKPGELLSIPGIGKSLARDLELLGYGKVSGLREQDPMEMYERLCEMTHSRQDRCVLYVFRCAVYFATENSHDPELLKWWNWKDKTYRTEGKAI
ncbi:MAG: Pathogenicity locus [Spirochaetes bacterium GWF1_51_8]|nr:MAG: Pathogenicity locus [Spirochaetes bacterium GWF1_51_8]